MSLPNPMSFWDKLSQDLNVEVQTNVLVPGLESMGKVPVLLKGFGGRSGMIIVINYDQIEPFANEASAKGYGFSTFTADDSYSRLDAIDMLRDWGWSEESTPPVWLT